MKYKISVLMPAIRTHKWVDMYDSLLKSCKTDTFELVMVSPFELPSELATYSNIKLIKDNGCPTRAAQLGIGHCEGELLYHCVDDAIFLDDSIDLALAFYEENCTQKDVVNMTYTEGQHYLGYTFPPEFWMAHYHGELSKLAGIHPEWKISLHHFMSLEYFRSLGGWDCQFEYLNHPLHDLMFRVQADGGKLYDSPITATSCDHYPGRSVDHAAIHDAQVYHDQPIFEEMYSDPDAAFKRIHIDLDNWKNCPEVWDRRFKNGVPQNYDQIMAENV